jgi:hypothetical protein
VKGLFSSALACLVVNIHLSSIFPYPTKARQLGRDQKNGRILVLAFCLTVYNNLSRKKRYTTV